MTNTTSQSPLHSQAEASVDAVAAEIQRAARQELEALRGVITTRLAALERSLDRDPGDPAFDPIVQRLCAVAAEQADAAAASARAQAEEAAARVLVKAREQAQSELDATRRQNETAQAQNKSLRLDLERRLALAEAAAAEISDELTDLRAQRDAAQAEFEKRLAQSERLATEAARALDAAQVRIHTLEEEMAKLVVARDVAEAHLEGEVQTRTALATELDAVREMALYAQTDADTSRLALRNATDRIRVLEERYRKLDAEQPRRSAGAATGEAAAMLEQVRAGLQTLTATTSGRGLLDALLEPLAQHFSMVAWCAVKPGECVVWGSRGFDPPLPSRKSVRLGADSPLARALAESKPATVRPGEGQGPSGLAGQPVGYAIALPVATQDQGTVMLYAENPPDSATGDPEVGAKIADIFADHVRRRLSKKQTARTAQPSAPSPERQARRVRIKKNVNVTVDGAPSALVDLSTTGAQVLSPRAVEPNHSVRLTLPDGNGGLSCEARVVWVVVEHPPNHKNAVYRAGIQFRGADVPELDEFFNQHGVGDPAIKH